MNHKCSEISILQVGNYYQTSGGISALMRNLTAGLNNEGYHVKIFSVGGNSWFFRIIQYLKLPFIICKFKIIHAHCCSNIGLLPAIISYLFSLVLTKKFIITFHGSVDNAENVANNFFFRNVLSKNVIITTPTDINAEKFKYVGFNAIGIQNIFDLNGWIYKERTIINPLFICSRSKYNSKLVLNTFFKVLLKYPKAELIMLGEFDNKESLDIAKKCKSIKITGNIEREKVVNYLNTSDVYINSCNNDSFGYSIYEAIACGLAVVSVESPSLQKDIGNDIVLFSDDSINLSETIFEALNKQQKTIERIEKGGNKARSLSWNNLKKQWIDIFNSIN